MNVTGKVAIVTGSGGVGSGRAYARRLAHEGATVVVCDVDESGGRETVRLIGSAGGLALFRRTDVGDREQVRALFDFVVRECGGVDILINNASPAYHASEPLDWWFEPVEIDLLGAMAAMKFAIPVMRGRGGGAIVNIGSTSALGHGRKHSKSPAYDVAKAGLARLTTTLGWLRDSDRIRVNCLVPDWIAVPEVLEYWQALSPQERRDQDVPDALTTLDEVADAMMELVTNEQLAGRVLVWWSGKPRHLIAEADPGYAGFEPI